MAVGAAMLIAGCFWYQSTMTFVASALTAEGVVLRNEESDSSDSAPSYHAVVAFTDQSGRRITYRDSIGSSPPMYSTGDKVRVLYAPADSSSAMIDRGMWDWLVPLLIGGAGALMLGLSGWSFISRRDPSTGAPVPQ
jgi:hypothetical protein